MEDDNIKGFSRGLTNYGDKEFSLYLRRSFAKAMGFTNESLDKPIIGIADTSSNYNNCHRNVPEQIEAVNRGVLAAGGLPMVFPTISLAETFLHPTSMIYRNLMSMDTEEMINAQPMDAVVVVGGCDKNVPAQLMGAISANKPTIQLITGPMITNRYEGERLGACTDCRRFWAMYRAQEIEKEDILAVESRLATTAGTCPVMGTASTMACIAETLGFILPNTAAIPAVHADRLRAAEETGKHAVKLATNGLTPNKVITEKSVENALRVLLAIGGSTNGIIHLTAIAGRAGIKVSLNRLNQISDETPVLVNLKPSGDHYMEDFYAGGGLHAVLREIKHLMHLDTVGITGKSLGELLEEKPGYIDRNIIRPFNAPHYPLGGLVAVFGSLAPNGAILKRAAADANLFESEGRAVVFNSPADLSERIDDPDLEITPENFIVLQNAGPKSGYGMPECGYLPIPRKLARTGIKDIVRISDARMSGTAYGTIILHVSPEASDGGPLGLVQNGDRIRLSIKNRSFDLLVSEEELSKRRAKLKIIKPEPRGYLKLYQNHVLQAEEGCDFDFLRSV